ncbi:MAG: hypothetical protein KME59_03645 [Trichormus sp. ATA11-4-KO1]|jgi:hypothetical protein|nr:hypothetical protein [Trichormus sp. ATA11-4-KO1]
MMTDLNNVINQYAVKLSELKSENVPQFYQVVQVLIVRDYIQEFIDENNDIENKSIIKDITEISRIDTELKQQLVRLRTAWTGKNREQYLEKKNKLEKEIDLYTKTPNSWWWTRFRHDISNWDRLDVITNVATVLVSIGATTIFTQTLQILLSIGGSSFVGTFTTLTQASLGVFFASGTLTDTGKKKVHKLLDKISIPRHFHSEVILLVAIMLSGAFWQIKEFGVSQLEKNYTQQAQAYFHENDFYQSINIYKKLQILNPNFEISPILGFAYELNLQLDQAKAEYIKGIAKKDAQSLIGLSRVTVLQELLQSESGLLGNISQGDITIIQLYLNDARRKILNELLSDILHIINFIPQDKISPNVQQAIDFIKNITQDESYISNRKYFHEVILALDKINLEIKDNRISNFLSKLYSPENQATQLLIEARTVEIILNWSKVNFQTIDLSNTNLSDFTNNGYLSGEFIVAGFEEQTPEPPFVVNPGSTEEYITIYEFNLEERDKRYQEVLIAKYKKLPIWKKLNCYLQIDKYLNTVNQNANINDVSDEIKEQLQTQTNQTFQCLNNFRNNNSPGMQLSVYEVQLMFEVFNTAFRQAETSGLISIH